MKRICNLAAAALMTALCAANTASALPLVWRADWPDAKPVETLVHRGTDVELQPLWRINKEPADTNGWTFTTFCQTNAVGPWFGPLPGAFFSHTNDVGADFYNVMVRAQTPGGTVNYTAFARLRMLDSPGFAPGELPLPAQSIDFADVEVFNAPWYTKAETEAKIVELAPAPGDYAAVSNAAMSAMNTADAATTTNAQQTTAISTLSANLANKASTADATLTERGFGPWKFSPATIVDRGVLRTLYMGIDPETGKGFPAFDDAEYGQIHYGESRDLAETTEQIWHAGIETPCTENITATRTALPGYVLGTQIDKPLASEAEAEALRTAIAGLAQNNDYDRLPNKPQINGVTLSGNKTGADLGLLDLTGGKMAGDFSVGGSYVANFQVVPEKYTGGENIMPTMRFSDGAGVVGIIWHLENGYVEMEVSDVMGSRSRIALPSASGTLALKEDIPAVPSPTAPVASATLAWQSNGSAIVVSVPANGTLSATFTGWIEGQTQTALITLAAGASVSPQVKLVGYGTWPTDRQFLASATLVGNNVYVTPITLVN